MEANASLLRCKFPLFPYSHLSTCRFFPALNPHCSSLHLRLSSSRLKAIRDTNKDRNLVTEIDELREIENGDLLVETCVTRNLSPALTLEAGLDKIKDEIDKLKLNPPASSRGMYRFQVGVPPSAKALKWFCCQSESSGVFPQFFLLKKTDDFKSISAATRGTFGVGAAVNFQHSSSCTSEQWSSFTRYLSPGSSLAVAYCLVGLDANADLFQMKHEAGPSYFFVPQIELDEHEGVSILAANLAWSDSSLRTFLEAVQLLELSLHQLNDMKSLLLGIREDGTYPIELKEATSSHRFYARLSSTYSIAVNMLDGLREMTFSVQNFANINTVWASLIIEECIRLGLTYFCIAPGSRSSPLTIAASSHPLATCTVCYDERSLAFHALGYARGSRIPAVIITTSGTAISNLLPAVVEASQDFVPLMLLTADRPPELQCSGANQAMNQVNHYGSFVRYFFSLPAPTDDILARMVLSSIDSAVYWAMSSPNGPVHINCPFREPLENSPSEWKLSCLEGLDSWMRSSEPFTQYIRMNHSTTSNAAPAQMVQVLKVIQQAQQGILLIGSIHTEDEMWAALLLAKHLHWPVVPDILSGLRLRKILSSFPTLEDSVLFLDHLDHVLLSELVTGWMQADVIVQIGSKITSKRISQMLEKCCPFSYIMVDKHPCRHDPSHIVTHRIQSTITEFADCLLKACFPPLSSKWSIKLNALNTTVAQEISFHICSENSLTELYVAHILSEMLSCESALFLGNSMVVRDAEMFGRSENCTHSIAAAMLGLKLPCHWIQVAGNRGVSGIDGLLSTAIGFAVGCNKRVFCVLGDVSFLHDTNGLAILSQRMWRKPMTILVVNNHGGAIFSLLPIANRVEPRLLKQYFYTSHDISIGKLCEAHGIKHLQVRNKVELQDALITSERQEVDFVIEVESSIDTNATLHSNMRKFASEAASLTLSIMSKISVLDSSRCNSFSCKILSMEYSLYRVSLCAPPTTSTISYDPQMFYREGFVLTLYLEDGSVGFGEVAPIDTDGDKMIDIEEQLRFLLHVIRGTKISYCLPLLKGSFSSWIWSSLGIPPSSVIPSIKCGLEMAILNSMAASLGTSLCSILNPQMDTGEVRAGKSTVPICALVDSNGTALEIAHVASTLAQEGFATLKLKVARKADPLEDAEVIKEVRKKVGPKIGLLADANRKWAYHEAIQFGASVKSCDLLYIEEPVQNEHDILKFCEETGIAAALDETLNFLGDNPLEMLANFTHRGIAAVVIKPSVVGGLENAALIARWAQQQGKMVIISSTFESSLALSVYVQFSFYLDSQKESRCRITNTKSRPSLPQGLGTYKWLKDDLTLDNLKIGQNPDSGFIEASVLDADLLLKKFQLNQNTVVRSCINGQVRAYELDIHAKGLSCSLKVQEIGSSDSNNILVFIHGFLGTSEDWIPIMKAISGSARCISLDLPGHGRSKMQSQTQSCKGAGTRHGASMSIEAVANILYQLIHHITPGKVTIVGYSMGARIALYMALKFPSKIEGAVIISGSPGIKNVFAKKVRGAKDDSRARSLVSDGLQLFLENWYSGKLWESLRGHPHFNQMVGKRLQHDNVQNLANALSDLSIGRQPSLWGELKECKMPLLLIVGKKDTKFRNIAREMLCELGGSTGSRDSHQNGVHKMIEVPTCGHAVHIEDPFAVVSTLRRFLREVKRDAV